jgi:hypothetical protein
VRRMETEIPRLRAKPASADVVPLRAKS